MGEEPGLLSDALAELASMSAEACDVTELLHVACERARALLGADGAAVLLSVDGTTLQVAGHSGLLGDESLLSEPSPRPCEDVLRTGEPHVLSADVPDERYPGYDAALATMGIVTTVTLPLRHAQTVIGAITLVRNAGAHFDEASLVVGQRIADVVAAAIVKEQALRAALAVTAQLEHALKARVVVEQAKGMVAAELSVSIVDALEMIRQFARRQHLRLTDVADDIVERRLPVSLLRCS